MAALLGESVRLYSFLGCIRARDAGGGSDGDRTMLGRTLLCFPVRCSTALFSFLVPGMQWGMLGIEASCSDREPEGGVRGTAARSRIVSMTSCHALAIVTISPSCLGQVLGEDMIA